MIRPGRVVFSLLICGLCACTQDKADLDAAIDDLLDPLVSRDLVSGTIIIARDGEVVAGKGFGLANRETLAPNTLSTRFRIASLSKSITAVAIMRLVEDGRLGLDDTLDQWVPGFKYGDRITIANLLGHESGIPSDVYLANFAERSVSGETLADAVDWVKSADPRFEPGAKFEYSNSGYVVLSAIVEIASGQRFEDYLAQSIFEPLGMNSSGLDGPDKGVSNRAIGYSRTEAGKTTRTAYRHPSYGWGYGALYSTAEDLLRFGQSLFEGQLVSPASREAMTTRRNATPWGNGYGLGFFTDITGGKNFIEGLGSTGGFVASMRYFPDDEVFVIILLNHDFLLYDQLLEQLSRIALGRDWKPLFDMAPESARVGLIEFLGSYEMDDGTVLELRRERSGLVFGDTSAGHFFEIFPLSKAEAYVPDQNARLRFKVDADGEIRILALYGNYAWIGRRLSK